MIFSPLTRWLICPVTFSQRSASSCSFRAARSLACAPRPPAGGRGQLARLLHRALQQLPRLGCEREHLGLRLPGAAADRARQRPELAAHRLGAIPDRGPLLLDLDRELASLPRQRPHTIGREPRVGRIAHIGLDHGRVDPRGPRAEPLLPPGFLNHLACDLVHDLRTQPAGEFADRRLVRHSLGQSQPAEAAQMDRVRHLPHQRLVPPPGAVLDDHQPHIHLHRNRRSPPPRRRASLGQQPLPPHSDRQQQPGICEQLVQRREIVGQGFHLRGQDLVPQRLRTGRRHGQHTHPPDRS